MLPLFHDFEGRAIVVVGGGPVAHRKARTFAEVADVTVVASEFVDRFEDLECTLVRRTLEPAEAPEVVAGASLVVPATDDQRLNDALAAAAREAGCLVNRVDERGDVVTPSRAESDRVTVAISTDGASPAMSKYLRKRLEPLLERADPMVALQAELREELQAADEVPTAKRREALWSVLEDDRTWALLEDGREEAARERAWELIDDLE
ncbi:precorrin-2 dehydrogenase/sirohydrochlorin ferrochelatase family protein [Natronobeatus ordinarius]|uniref:precorrin-2 dehydrogenase/sirohydrochlorin ferrochelatase family protein n=1 Tax=Natronobeatus ordinarius TaxID=2963433 RepID=UPI0020CB6FCA|nr:bifunctional precorrin-2 dehydrogenase/sirohydrochlorin ferrochelatase [Natronobeatus ordinarius]